MKKVIVGIVFCMSWVFAQSTTFFRTYGLGIYDVGEDVTINNDTTYTVAGITNSGNGNGADILFFKTNSTGDVIWRNQLGDVGPDGAKAIVNALDNGGYLVAGYENLLDSTGYNIKLIKINSAGNIVWSRTWGGNDFDMANSLTTLSDSTYILAGETYSYGNGGRDIYLIKFNANGDTLWTKTYGGANDDAAEYIFTDRNNQLLIVGNTKSFGAGNSDVYLLHLDVNGDTLWTKTIGTPDDDFGYSATMYVDTANNEMDYVVGYTSYYAPDLGQNTYLARIDSVDGNIQATYPEGVVSIILLDKPHVAQTAPGKITFFADYREAYNQNCILFCEKSEYNFFAIDASTYAAGGNENTSQNTFKIALDGGFLVTGYSENWGPGFTSAILLKTDANLNSPDVPAIGIENLESDYTTLFPNPVTGEHFYINSTYTILGVRLFNMNGQLIQTKDTPTGTSSVTVQKPLVERGIYIAEIITDKGTIRKKIIF